MKIYKLIIPALAILGMVACKSQYELLLSSNDVDAKYAEAFRLYETGKYKKAASMFESLSVQTTGMPQDDTVRYYWALSNYKYKDYVTADANFNSFIEFYPRSPFTPEARFLRLDCMYRSTYRYELDQTPTHLAIAAISEYIIEYPESDRIEVLDKMLVDLNERLDTKAFEAARLYFKMEDYIAAKTTFKNILKDDADNIHREEILYYIAKSSYKYAALSVPAKQKERFMEFVDDYYNFVGEYPESQFRKEVDRLYDRAQRAMSGTLTRDDLKNDRKETRKDSRMK